MRKNLKFYIIIHCSNILNYYVTLIKIDQLKFHYGYFISKILPKSSCVIWFICFWLRHKFCNWIILMTIKLCINWYKASKITLIFVQPWIHLRQYKVHMNAYLSLITPCWTAFCCSLVRASLHDLNLVLSFTEIFKISSKFLLFLGGIQKLVQLIPFISLWTFSLLFWFDVSIFVLNCKVNMKCNLWYLNLCILRYWHISNGFMNAFDISIVFAFDCILLNALSW